MAAKALQQARRPDSRYLMVGVEVIDPATHQEVMNSLRLFGKYVIPHFKGKERRARAAAVSAADNS